MRRSKSSIRPTSIKPAIIQYPRVRLNSPPKIPINVMVSAGTNRLIVILSHSNARKTPSPIACRLLIYKLADSVALFIRASTTAFSAASLPALSNCLASSRSSVKSSSSIRKIRISKTPSRTPARDRVQAALCRRFSRQDCLLVFQLSNYRYFELANRTSPQRPLTSTDQPTNTPQAAAWRSGHALE